MKFEQAKELDAGLNKGVPADTTGPSGGHLQIGNHDVDQLRRENDKRERQAEYQAFLSKQAQQKKAQMSPGRLKERINSAR